MTKVPTGVVTIYSTKYPRAAFALRGETVVASEGQINKWEIKEAEGSDAYTICLAGEDAYMELQALGQEQLHVSYDKKQSFYIVPVSGKDNTLSVYFDTPDDVEGVLGFTPYQVPIYPPFYMIRGWSEKNNKRQAEEWIIKSAE